MTILLLSLLGICIQLASQLNRRAYSRMRHRVQNTRKYQEAISILYFFSSHSHGYIHLRQSSTSLLLSLYGDYSAWQLLCREQEPIWSSPRSDQIITKIRPAKTNWHLSLNLPTISKQLVLAFSLRIKLQEPIFFSFNCCAWKHHPQPQDLTPLVPTNTLGLLELQNTIGRKG